MDNTTQSWRHLSAIQISGTLCLPVIMIGHVITETYGGLHALCAIIMGNILLAIASWYVTQHAYNTRQSTADIALSLLGPHAGTMLAITMALVMLGWFSVQIAVTRAALLTTAQYFSIATTPFITTGITWFLGIVITVLVMAGIESIAFISYLALPLLVITLALTLYQKSSWGSFFITPTFSGLIKSIALVIASSLALVIDLPTYYRHARSYRDSWISTVLLFLIATPIVQALGIIITGTSQETIADIFAGSGGPLWHLWLALFFIISCFAINAANLYSATTNGCLLTSHVYFINKNYVWPLTAIFIGFCGTVLALTNLVNSFEQILTLMNISVVSLGALLLAKIVQYTNSPTPSWEIKQTNYNHTTYTHTTKQYVIIWLLASFMGFLETATGVTITHHELLDTFIFTLIFYGGHTLLTRI